MVMKIYERIGDEKVQCDLNRKDAKISALSSSKQVHRNTLQVKKHYLLIEVEK